MPRFLALRELLEEGTLGTLTAVHYRMDRPVWKTNPETGLPWRLKARESGGGLFFDLGSHVLDLLDFLLGPMSLRGARARNLASPIEVEDSIAMLLETEAGAPVCAVWNFAGFDTEDRLELCGMRGRAVASVFGDEPLLVQTSEGERTIERPNQPHIQQPLIQTIVDALLKRGSCLSTGTSAARTSALMDAAVLEYYGSRDIGCWDHPASWPGRPGWLD